MFFVKIKKQNEKLFTLRTKKQHNNYPVVNIKMATESISNYLGGIQCSADNERVGFQIKGHSRLGGKYIPVGLVGSCVSTHGLMEKHQRDKFGGGGNIREGSPIPVPIPIISVSDDNTYLAGAIEDSIYENLLNSVNHQ